jgi:hypothetical protein
MKNKLTFGIAGNLEKLELPFVVEKLIQKFTQEHV